MKIPLLTGIVLCLLCNVVIQVDSRGSKKKELPTDPSLNLTSSKSKDLVPAATTFVLNKAVESGFGTQSGSSSGSSSGVRKFRGVGFGNAAGSSSGFNYPTKYSIGTISSGIHGDDIGLDDYDDVHTYENIGSDGHDLGYSGVGNVVLGGLPHGDIGYGISKSGLGLSHSLGHGGGLSSHGGLTKGLSGGSTLTIIPGITSGEVHILGGDIHREKAYKKGAGSSAKANHEAVAGEEAAKGYKVAEDFDKAQKGHVEKAQQAGHYDAAAGSKKGELDEAKKYSEKHAAVKGEKGETFEKSEGHKKGHKTSGYHNVYHKDEYKKDTTFYDDEHVSAHQESFGAEGSQHTAAKGGHEKVEKLDKKFHEDEHAKKGSFTNGHQYGAAQGHDREHAEKEHYEKSAEFGKESKQRAEKEVASSSDSSHKGL